MTRTAAIERATAAVLKSVGRRVDGGRPAGGPTPAGRHDQARGGEPVQIVSSTDRRDGSWARVTVSGRIESRLDEQILRSALAAVWCSDVRGMSLDLGGVEELGGGLETLRSAVLDAADRGCWVEIVNASISVHRALSADGVLGQVVAAYAWRRPGERNGRHDSGGGFGNRSGGSGIPTARRPGDNQAS
jgi:hypothetical protein